MGGSGVEFRTTLLLSTTGYVPCWEGGLCSRGAGAVEVAGGVVVRMMMRGAACMLPSAWRSRWDACPEPNEGPCSTKDKHDTVQALYRDRSLKPELGFPRV